MGGSRGAASQPVDVPGNPGFVSLVASLVLALGTGLATLLFVKADVDDRGDAVPLTGFGGLYLRAREALGGTAKTTQESMIDANGPAIVAFVMFPALIALGAIIIYKQRRARGQSVYWPLTIAMILMALSIMMGASHALPAMVAMAIAGFQVRKVELPARMAAQEAAEDEDEDEDDEYEDDDEFDEGDEGYEEDESDVYDEDADYEDEDEDPEDDEEDLVDEEPEAPKKK